MNWIGVANYEEMSDFAARRIFDFVANMAAGKRTFNIGLATGNTMIKVYDELAKLLNCAGTDLNGMSTFNLDEYADRNGRNVPSSHPLSYRKYMRENFFSKLNPELGFSEERIFFPNASDPQQYDRQINQAGGLDFQLLGIGFNGHIAFNEPMGLSEISIEDFMKLPSRVIPLTELTIRTNAMLTAGNDLNTVPHHAVTQGMSSILSAKTVLLLACFEEQAKPLEKIKTGNITPALPASCLLRHPDCSIVYTCDKIRL